MERGERKGSGLPAVALMWWEIRSPPRNEKNSRRGKKASHVSTLMSRRASQIVLPHSTYEETLHKRFMNFLTLQPLVVDQALMPYMKAMHVPFHLLYGSLICYQRLQSDRPK